MAIQLTDLTNLDAARTQQLLALFTQMVQEKYPNIELSRGVFHDLVLYFTSALNATVQENIERVLQSNSLLAITADPTLADETVVDKILSNYNVSRTDGNAAIGEVVVVTNSLATTRISDSTLLSANSATFVPTRTFTGILPGQAASDPGDRTLLPVGNGQYAFTITVRSTVVGKLGNIPRGTKLIPNSAPSNVSSIYAAADFSDGLDPLTNEEYIAKLPEGLAAKTIGGRRSFSATIRAQEEFKNIRHLSVVGYGDPEQRRDQHSLIPISGGGRVDIYAQTNATAQRTDNLLTATYVGPVSPTEELAGTIWRVIINKDTAPGFYDIARVAKIDDDENSGYEIINVTRGYNFSGLDYAPDIANMEEAEFTRYKTTTFDFIDVDTKPSDLAPNQTTATYAVTTRQMPLISQLQDFISSRDVRCRAADVVVKAAVPCFTTISFKVLKTANELDPDFDAIKAAIVEAVAGIGFGGQLNASTISNAVYQFLTGNQAVSSIDMFGKILRPDGAVAYLRDFSKLVIPNDPERLVSPKTTVFLVSPDDIYIESEVVAGFNA